MTAVVSELIPLFSEPGNSCTPTEIADTQAVVTSNQPVNRDYFHMKLEVGGVALGARAGQFFNLACPTTATDMPFLRRPMSIYGVSLEKGLVEFLYKVTGAGTRALATLRAGDKLAMFGPLGNGFTLDRKWKNIVALGRGVGLATLAPLAEMASAQGVAVTTILSARSQSLVMSADRFARAGCKVEVVLDTNGSSDPQNVERILRRLIEKNRADAFFTCGSNRLLLLMKRLASQFNIPGQVAMEQQMACGVGMCFSCVRTFEGRQGKEQRRVCIEGPVFNLDEALSW